MACRAVRYSDEMHCAGCGLRWDVNDPEPPPCPKLAADEYENGKGEDDWQSHGKNKKASPARHW